MKRIFFGPLPPHLAEKNIKDPPLTMSVPLLFLAIVSFMLCIYPSIVLDLFHHVIGKL
jgi:formate hydrogenlyase subunit 3/multisubunit Na+/H+ antiporter MnhD subunit